MRTTMTIRILSACLIAAALLTGMCSAMYGQAASPSAATAPSVEGDAGLTKPAQGPEMSILDMALKGGWFMIPVALASLIGVAIIVERLFALRRGRNVPSGFLGGLKAAFPNESGDVAAGVEYCRAKDCPVGRMLSAGIHKLHAGTAAVEEALEDVGANEVSKMRRNLRLLFGVAAVSPMIGLLGSVSGMIRSFQIASLQGVGKAELLSKGIYEALVCTFGGLLVAIPTLLFYYYFLNKIDGIVTEMNDVSQDFLQHYLAPHTSPAKER
jgi:biopolymer transport protein ExbB